MPIDVDLIGALHVERMGRNEASVDPAGEHPHHVLFQTSTIGALLDGVYEGDLSYAELASHGDFGIGTFDALDGEMVALDGAFYQVRADGRAYEVDGETKTPFAVVTFFKPGLFAPLAGSMDYADLRARLDEVVGDLAVVHAVRVDGLFRYVKTRSVPRQRRPYPPLVEVVERQPVFEFYDVRGSLVGFRFPDYAAGMNVSGYHFHFITDDRSVGGHLLECRLEGGELRVDHESDLELELPAGVEEAAPGLSAEQREDIEIVEND